MVPSRTRRCRAALLAGACGLVASVSITSSAAADSGWVATPEGDELDNSQVETVQGTPQGNDVCQYNITTELPPGQDEVAQQEIAENPSTCQMRLEEGTPADDNASPASSARRSSEKGVRSHQPRRLSATTSASGSGWVIGDLQTSDAGDDGTYAPVYEKAAVYRTWYEDPAGLDVNKVSNNIQWKYNGNCVVHKAYAVPGLNWLWESGWNLADWDGNFDVNCNHARQAIYAHFNNYAFCQSWTDVYYDRNHFAGKPDGTWTGGTSYSKSGLCAGALSFHADAHDRSLFVN
jgi:hypothetical protein